MYTECVQKRIAINSKSYCETFRKLKTPIQRIKATRSILCIVVTRDLIVA